ncbi:S8 family serine peptidase [Mesorhizobium sp. ZC-5]|uniref:S8 family serine peptidase n=1 Tax=Mesorhizobium sp. ZC-5 TaxID=2986066 RepID=UPI0021E6ED49|nr:S8 family serine peptidase [Mesorhizobium sp. ZC-5]MCV3242448.1 S8 family serine peptidase [Mesorhizobium sp. ZC-5]
MAGNVLKRSASLVLATALLAAGPVFAQTAPTVQPSDNGQLPDREPSGRLVVILPDILVDLFDGAADGSARPGDSADLTDPAPVPTPNPGPGSPPPGDPAQASPANPPPSPLTAPQAVSGDFVPDEVLVTIDGDAQSVQDIAAALNLDIRSQRLSTLLGVTVVRYGIPDGRPVGVVLAQLAGDQRTLRREPNHIYDLQQAAAIVNYAFQRIALDSSAASGENVRVAVIDTAVDDTHPALSGVIAGTFDAMPGTPVEDRDHGTSIAGLIAGVGPFRGIAPGAAIYHARAFEGGKSTMDVLLAALDWAAEQDVRIVNMSFVGPRNDLLELGCMAARKRGMVLVAAAGNNGPKAPYGYPAAYDGVIAVTATDEKDELMPKANRGPYVFISAPGVEVLAPVGGGTDVVTGTSFAAAIVTGAITNLLHAAPDHDAGWIEEALAETASDLGDKGRDSDFGFGLMNTRAVLDRKR